MKLFQFIFYIVVAYLVLGFVRRLLAGKPRSAGSEHRTAAGRTSNSSRLIRCAACGVFITERSAMIVGQSGFCSKACAEGRVHRV